MREARVRRPYEKKIVKKSSALIFGVGAGALLATTTILLGLTIPILGPHLDNLVYRVRSTYRKLMPHPEYLPTPMTAATAPVTPTPAALQADLQSSPTPQAESLGTKPHDATSALLPPTATPTTPATIAPSPTPTPTVAIALASPGNSLQLSGFTHQWQTWNNCGPATITMNMSYFGRPETQVEAAQFLKPNRDDKNVSPEELAAYARTTGLEAMVRRGGTVDQIKSFLSNNLPVLAETWLVHEGDGLGHYRLVTGFDDTTGQFTTLDSLNGPNFKVSYEQFDADWRVFNRLYIVVYPPEQAQTVAAIIGPDMDERVMYERILSEADVEAHDAIAYFNQGEALAHLERPQEAVVAFDRARQLGLHWRRLWYQFTPFEAYYAVGRYQDVLALAEATIKGAGGLEEAYYYRGLALQATGQPGAEADFQAALDYNPNFAPAAEALNVLSTGG